MRGTSIHRASLQPAVSHTIVADPVKAKPMVWANRFGGPGTDLSQLVRRGAATRVANWPSGEIFGPAATRATNPYVRGMRSHAHLVASATTAIVKTPRATVRAAASLTGLGNEKNLFIPHILAKLSTLRYAVMARRTVVTTPTAMI